jgi:glycosyltransferase involved in cell wall biosynthesis
LLVIAKTWTRFKHVLYASFNPFNSNAKLFAFETSAIAVNTYETYLETIPVKGFIVDSSPARRTGYKDPLIRSVEPVRHLRVMMLGLRGFPNVQGGVETHVEHLAPLLVAHGCRLEVIVRQTYQLEAYKNSWRGVKFINIWSPKFKGLEAVVHTFLGVLYAAVARPDVLHIQAIGPALFTPLARMFGLNVVVTHHGPDYDRQKWGRFAKITLKLGEYFGMRYANGRIVISNVIRELVESKHQVKSEIIHNGVVLPDLDFGELLLKQFGLVNQKYVLIVSRLVPEKRHIDLITAFVSLKLPEYKLAIVGSSDHPDEYVKTLLDLGSQYTNVVFTGFQKGDALKSLYTHAALFVLPSSHEGLSISLLEALSYGLSVLASDIPANLEINLDDNRYFQLGNIDDMAKKIHFHLNQPLSNDQKSNIRYWIDCEYNWNKVAAQTYAEYRKAFH